MKTKKRSRKKLLSILKFWEKGKEKKKEHTDWTVISYYKNNRVQ